MKAIIATKIEFCQQVLADPRLDQYSFPASMEGESEEKRQRHVEVGWSEQTPHGTYQFFERCVELGVTPHLSVVKGIYSSWDQTEVELPSDAPSELKNRLTGLVQTQESDDHRSKHEWYREQRKRERWF